jgi:hypothetical protein
MDSERLKIKGGMLITPRDILLITGGSCTNSAYREHLQVRDALGKKSKRLSIKAYCDYWELDYEMTVAFLNANR